MCYYLETEEESDPMQEQLAARRRPPVGRCRLGARCGGLVGDWHRGAVLERQFAMQLNYTQSVFPSLTKEKRRNRRLDR
jgi:hypothetical protein